MTWEGPKEGSQGGLLGAQGSGLSGPPVLLRLSARKQSRLQGEGAAGCDEFFFNHLIMIKDLILSPSLAGSDSIWSLSTS